MRGGTPRPGPPELRTGHFVPPPLKMYAVVLCFLSKGKDRGFHLFLLLLLPAVKVHGRAKCEG